MPALDALLAGRTLTPALLLQLEQERRKRETIAVHRHRFDFYGDECGCLGDDGLPRALGACKAHFRARPAQRPPGSHRSALDRLDWDVWVIEAGRGFGKTFSGAAFTTAMVTSGRWTRIALVSETVKDVRTVMIEGPCGLLALCPPWLKCVYEPSKATVTWYDEYGAPLAVGTIYSAEEPEQLRGPQFDGAWCDELAKWKHNQQMTWDMLQYGMRLGDHPQILISTTPRPTPCFRAIKKDPGTVITKGATAENAAQLAPDVRQDDLPQVRRHPPGPGRAGGDRPGGRPGGPLEHGGPRRDPRPRGAAHP
jgi:hypothetical protein